MHKIPDIAPFRKKLNELNDQMADPDFYSDQRRAADVSREQMRLSTLVEKFEAWHNTVQQLEENEAMAEDESVDEELREMAREELESLAAERDKLANDVLRFMIPPDATDSRNSVMEIRGGAGGDEANIFAGDLFRMYSRYAETRGWRVEVMSSSPADVGGFKEIIFMMTGEEAYKYLKFESGVHRVQRVPATETQGRIHTSTATVAVLPEAQEVDVELNMNDLDISTMRASGAGGQHVNTTDSAVMMVHKPTGVTVYCADERSQIKNRAKALTVMRSRLLKAKEEEEHAKYAAERKGQIGTGDRSERIRTYNYPQGRLTDHRIGLSLSLPTVVDGDLDDLIDALQNYDYEARIQNLLEKQMA
ncbi:peptide chain release factor 1 [Coraliomargarita sp. SDUM461003]|uniref:Peptide chain release factor 1 n=1 Tax=Thalassobacterium maritimum TaxID=3041265 RepID=A0ABU1ASU5_9BACT|nr:peptide chain release factor 1 [Coraliomargarita sp. SDUM461003]MBT61869.1 peptide chain release factor 1 [Puniceicoccaceae bacterium]MDQ8207225.1 peptide chain release factor 1 [Coraliomargarita sp. SDUM461003]|tara:strand:- start:745 stop:1833 length:1089 start_codon:yes stop_codon:yes gene_type:complete